MPASRELHVVLLRDKSSGLFGRARVLDLRGGPHPEDAAPAAGQKRGGNLQTDRRHVGVLVFVRGVEPRQQDSAQVIEHAQVPCRRVLARTDEDASLKTARQIHVVEELLRVVEVVRLDGGAEVVERLAEPGPVGSRLVDRDVGVREAVEASEEPVVLVRGVVRGVGGQDRSRGDEGELDRDPIDEEGLGPDLRLGLEQEAEVGIRVAVVVNVDGVPDVLVEEVIRLAVSGTAATGGGDQRGETVAAILVAVEDIHVVDAQIARGGGASRWLCGAASRAAVRKLSMTEHSRFGGGWGAHSTPGDPRGRARTRV